TSRRGLSHHPNAPLVLHQPSGSKVKLSRSRRRLSLSIPPNGLRGEAAGVALFALFWNSFIFVWTAIAVSGGGAFFALFSLPFWAVGLWLMWTLAKAIVGKFSLEVTGDRYTLTRQLWRWQKQCEGGARDLYDVKLTTVYTQNSRPVRAVALNAGTQTYKFGLALSAPEKDWVVSELQAFIADQSTH
ncbi:MAG: serine/threonine protein kinase, partial [Cyanobacteria bacterium P01_D01_bin.115]